ncbi:DUF7509 family protein [Salinadaptatus halalkaliphilus]|nr:hypothetical protein [Salinadaptatus halalkaliphilus]
MIEHIEHCAPVPRTSPTSEPFYVYVMGPYTAFDATYSFPDADNLESPFIEDPLFDPDKHRNKIARHTYEAALADLCESIRGELGAHAFLATDIKTIPTVQEAPENEPGMSVLDQSVAFSAVSDAVVFVFTDAGLTTGAGSEVGAILSDFNLRRRNPEPGRKPRKRIGLFLHNEFTSASIDEVPYTYDVPVREFTSKEQLLSRIQGFLEDIRREEKSRPFPVYEPY